MRRTRFPLTPGIMIVAALLGRTAAFANMNYTITDGTAEQVVSIDPQESMIWLNSFPVDPAGPYIDSISVAYGRPGGPSALNGQPVTILLYEDANGGSPQDAVLRWSTQATIANGNLNLYNAYHLPALLIHGNLVVGALYNNATAGSSFIAPLDTTAPSFADRSYVGFAASIDPQDLASIPAGQFGTIEGFGSVGNFRIAAHGLASVDDGSVSLLVEKSGTPGVVHLSWTGSQASYEVERATRADFSDGRILATGVTGTTYDDAPPDTGVWFYRVR